MTTFEKEIKLRMKQLQQLPSIEQEIKEKLKNWQNMLREYQRPDSWKATIQLLNTFIPFLGIWALMYLSLSWSYWITIGLALINTFLLVRIFIIQHDCGHLSFVESNKWNLYIGYFCSFFTTIPYKYWAKAHSYHHGHTGQLEVRDIGDINFLTVSEYSQLSPLRQFAYRMFRHPLVMFGLAPAIYFTISNRFPLYNLKGWKKIRISQVWSNLWLLLFWLTIAWSLGWKALFLVHVPIVFLFGIVAFWFFYVQHQHEESYKAWKKNWNHLLASIKGSTFYRLPKVWHWLTGNIGFHHIHHLNPRIPNYNLARAAKENPILQKYVTSITFKESLSCMFNKLWDEETQRMITFKEYYLRQRSRKISFN